MTNVPPDAPQSDAARAILQSLLMSYGLEELTSWAMDLLDVGASPQRVELELERQPAFLRRFPAIASRRQRNLPPMSVQEILYYERQVAELESFYGYPPGTLGDPQDRIADDVSYNELQAGVAAEQAFLQSDPEAMAAFERFYDIGATQGEVSAFMINQDVGLPVLQQRIQAANVAGQSVVAGFGDLSQQEAEDLVARGVDENAAREAFSTLARSSQLTQNFSRQDLISLAAGEAPFVERFERNRSARLADFSGGGGFAGLTQGIGTAQ